MPTVLLIEREVRCTMLRKELINAYGGVISKPRLRLPTDLILALFDFLTVLFCSPKASILLTRN